MNKPATNCWFVGDFVGWRVFVSLIVGLGVMVGSGVIVGLGVFVGVIVGQIEGAEVGILVRHVNTKLYDSPEI